MRGSRTLSSETPRLREARVGGFALLTSYTPDNPFARRFIKWPTRRPQPDAPGSVRAIAQPGNVVALFASRVLRIEAAR
jgi:hypothetical protein